MGNSLLRTPCLSKLIMKTPRFFNLIWAWFKAFLNSQTEEFSLKAFFNHFFQIFLSVLLNWGIFVGYVNDLLRSFLKTFSFCSIEENSCRIVINKVNF
jgi:hypothetical protein